MEQTDFWGNITEDESLGIYCRLYRQSLFGCSLYFAILDCRFIKAGVDNKKAQLPFHSCPKRQ